MRSARLGEGMEAASCEADGRVKIGQSMVEMLLEGREEPSEACSHSHFALCLVAELESACAPLAFPAGMCQEEASCSGFGFAFWICVISTCLKEKSAQMSKQTNQAENNARPFPWATFSWLSG